MLLLLFFATVAYSQTVCVRQYGSNTNCATVNAETDLNCSSSCSALGNLKWANLDCPSQTITYYSNSLCTLSATTFAFDVCGTVSFGSARDGTATDGPCVTPTVCLGIYNNEFCHNSEAQYSVACDADCVQIDPWISVWVKTFCTTIPTIEYYSDSSCTVSTITATTNFSVCAPTYTAIPFAYAKLGACPVSVLAPMCIETYNNTCVGAPTQTSIQCGTGCTQVESIWANFECESNLVTYYNDSNCEFLYVTRDLAATQCSSLENTGIIANLGNCRPLPICLSIFHQNTCDGDVVPVTLRCNEECAPISMDPPVWAKINCGTNNATFYNDSVCSQETSLGTFNGSQCTTVTSQLSVTLTNGICSPQYACYTSYLHAACTGIVLNESIECGVCNAVGGYYILPNCITGTAIKSNTPDCSGGIEFNFDVCTTKQTIVIGSCQPKTQNICISAFNTPSCFNLATNAQLTCYSCFDSAYGFSYGLDCNQTKLIQYDSVGCSSETYSEFPFETCSNGINTYNGTCLIPPQICMEYYSDNSCNEQIGYNQLDLGTCKCQTRQNYDFGVNCASQELDLFAPSSQCSNVSSGSFSFDTCHTIPNVGNVKFANKTCDNLYNTELVCLARFLSTTNDCNGQLNLIETAGCEFERFLPNFTVFGICNESVYSAGHDISTSSWSSTLSSIYHQQNQCFPDSNGKDAIILGGACPLCERVSLTILDTPVSTFPGNCTDIQINHLVSGMWSSASNAIQNTTTDYCFTINCVDFTLQFYQNTACSGIPTTIDFSAGCTSISLGDEIPVEGLQSTRWISVSPETTCNITCATTVLRNITIVKAGTGSGTVTTSNQYNQNFGINCGIACNGLFLDGSLMYYTITPDVGSTVTMSDLSLFISYVSILNDATFAVTFDLLPSPTPSPSPSISPSPTMSPSESVSPTSSPSISPSPSVSPSSSQSMSPSPSISPSPSDSATPTPSSETIVPSSSESVSSPSDSTTPTPSSVSPSPSESTSSPSPSVSPSPSISTMATPSSDTAVPSSSVPSSPSESITPTPSSESISPTPSPSTSASPSASPSPTVSSEISTPSPSSVSPSPTQSPSPSSSEYASNSSESVVPTSVYSTPTSSPSQSPSPTPTPTPIPTGCVREYSSPNCTGNYTFQNVIALSGCTNINMSYPALRSISVAGSSAIIYLGLGCTSTITASTTFYTCVKYQTPLVGSFVVNGIDCELPNPVFNVTPPAPAPPPGPPPPNVNCIYLYTSLGCVNLDIWAGLPCDGFCTQISPSLWAATSCSSNVTGIYTESTCSTPAVGLASNANCGTIVGNVYKSFKTLFNSTCPPLPPAPAPAPFPAPAPPSGPACFENFSLPFCGGVVTQQSVTCQTCVANKYFVDCNANIVSVRTAGCGSQVGTLAFSVCSVDNVRFSIGVCPALPPPPPPPPPPNQTCVSFYLAGTCSGLKIDEPYTGYCWNTSSEFIPNDFFTVGPSLYRSFKFDCINKELNFFTTSDCTGSNAVGAIGNPGCFPWTGGAVKLTMSTDENVCAPCIRTPNIDIHIFFSYISDVHCF